MPALHTAQVPLSDVARKGLALYREKLKPLREPEQNGRAIAPHVDTEEYVVADTSTEARREMLRRFPNPEGRMLSRAIGPEPDGALLQRLLRSGRKP